MIPEHYIWLQDAACPNCMAITLFAEAVDDEGAPHGDVVCCMCGASEKAEALVLGLTSYKYRGSTRSQAAGQATLL